jgi:hypothetical protein
MWNVHWKIWQASLWVIDLGNAFQKAQNFSRICSTRYFMGDSCIKHLSLVETYTNFNMTLSQFYRDHMSVDQIIWNSFIFDFIINDGLRAKESTSTANLTSLLFLLHFRFWTLGSRTRTIYLPHHALPLKPSILNWGPIPDRGGGGGDESVSCLYQQISKHIASLLHPKMLLAHLFIEKYIKK